jgi:hypothetical protein
MERMVGLTRLQCQECSEVSNDAARGWRTLLAPDPDEPEAGPMLATYCPWCATREFGSGTAEHALALRWMGPPGFEPGTNGL